MKSKPAQKKGTKQTTISKDKKKATVKEIDQREWIIKLYATEDGECPFNDFLDTLSVVDKEDIIKWIQYLKVVGYNIRRPQGDYLRDKIYELRVTLSGEITRTLYFFCYNDYIVLTHTFIKTTKEVPEGEINKANKI